MVPPTPATGVLVAVKTCGAEALILLAKCGVRVMNWCVHTSIYNIAFRNEGGSGTERTLMYFAHYMPSLGTPVL